MKTKLALAISSIMIASSAHAVQLIKDDKNDVQLTGLAYAGHTFGDSEKSAAYGNNTFFRFGTDAKSKIDDNLTVVGKYEAQVKMNDAENEINSGQGSNVRTRHIYGGLNVKDIGTFTYGRQWGTLYEMIGISTDTGYTDGYTGSALGLGVDRFASIRGSDLLKYQGTFGKAKVGASYKFRTLRDSATADNDNSAYALATTYEVIPNLTLGAAYTGGDRAASSNNASLSLFGLKYDDKKWYFATNYSIGSDFIADNVDHKGYETALAYTFTNGFGVQTTWEKERVDTGSSTVDGYNAYTVGVKYAFSPNLYAAFDYRVNKLPANAYVPVKAYGTGAAVDAANDFQFGIKYIF